MYSQRSKSKDRKLVAANEGGFVRPLFQSTLRRKRRGTLWRAQEKEERAQIRTTKELANKICIQCSQVCIVLMTFIQGMDSKLSRSCQCTAVLQKAVLDCVNGSNM